MVDVLASLDYDERRDSLSSMSSMSMPPAPPSEAEVLRASVKAASIAARCLKGFADDGPGSGPCAALRGFLAFAQGFVHSVPRWEREELRRFLECICATPQPKRARNAGPAPPPSPGDWVLDCYVAEQYYERSGFGRAVYRMLRARAEELAYVNMERRHSQTGPGSAGRSPRAPAKGQRAAVAPPSTTSVPLLIRLSPAGWDALRGELATAATSEPQSDILFAILQGGARRVVSPSPMLNLECGTLAAFPGSPKCERRERNSSLGSFDTRMSIFSQQSLLDFAGDGSCDDVHRHSRSSSVTTLEKYPVRGRRSPRLEATRRRSSWAGFCDFDDLVGKDAGLDALRGMHDKPGRRSEDISEMQRDLDWVRSNPRVEPFRLLASPGSGVSTAFGGLLSPEESVDLDAPWSRDSFPESRDSFASSLA